jgi:hypothetical protein
VTSRRELYDFLRLAEPEVRKRLVVTGKRRGKVAETYRADLVFAGLRVMFEPMGIGGVQG